jgi:hypothetical protein
VTLPKWIVDALGLRPGDQLHVTLTERGTIEALPEASGRLAAGESPQLVAHVRDLARQVRRLRRQLRAHPERVRAAGAHWGFSIGFGETFNPALRALLAFVDQVRAGQVLVLTLPPKDVWEGAATNPSAPDPLEGDAVMPDA